MRAVLLTRPGSPDVLEFADIPVPTPRATEVLVRVRTATVTRGDVALRRMPRLAWPLLRVGMGLKRKHILGHEFAGRVAAVGSAVTSFKVGDEVLGTTTGLASGSYAEYVVVPHDGPLVAKPEEATFDEAAALPTGAMTALWLLRAAKVEAGATVLIYGASGSVGSAAVQLASHMGAVTTGVCSTANVGMVRSLGAARVIDYTRDAGIRGTGTYDAIIDAVGRMPRSGRDALNPGGAFVSVTSTTRERREDLEYLRDLLGRRALRPVIDRRYSLDEIRTAHRYVEAGHKKGNVVIDVSD
jgi:NADPH:quinone reductase-like Zn-dependent oxidoreductase